MNLKSERVTNVSEYHGWRGSLGSIYPTFQLFLIGLVILSVFRCILAATYFTRLEDTPDIGWLFPIGVRMDILMMSYLTILPTLLLLVLPRKWIAKIHIPLVLFLTFALSLVLYMEVATFPFLAEYDLRPDRLFFEYLKHPREVFEMLIKAYTLELVVGTLVVGLCGVFFWKINSRALSRHRSWGLKTRLVLAPIVLGLLVLGARSTLGHRPANISTAAFSNNHLANELALNSTYSLVYAAYRFLKHEGKSSQLYGSMSKEEVFTRIKKLAPHTEGVSGGTVPNLHTQTSPFSRARPSNIVIFLQESMGASDVGCLGGAPVTPNLCSLKEEGMWFSNLYATGTRTVRGIESTVSGFLPTPNRAVVKLGRAKRGFFTAANLLKKHGYTSSFIYGGMSNFDEMRSFFLGNGFDEIIDEPLFESPVFAGTWGVSDEDLVRRANEFFVSKGDKPFFSLILSTSNHTPYEFPDGRIELYEEPKATHHNAIKYADYAIGLFFELAKKEEYFENTIFLVVADHNSHVRGNDLVPIDKFHIPGLIIGPDVPPQEYSKLSSQIDLLPTLLHFSGLTTEHPMVGRNLPQTPEDLPGRAIMQYGSHAAYQVEDQVVVLRPHVEPKQFNVGSGSWQAVDTDQEMVNDALAYAYLPQILYREQLYPALSD